MSGNPFLIDARWLSIHLIDSLAEQQQDWISWLSPDREIELYDFSLLGINSAVESPKCSTKMVSNLSELAQSAQHQSLTISQHVYSAYSCCLQTIGWGRVRLVVCFENPQHARSAAAFVTNRLDWSPRKILTQWDQHYPVMHCFGKQISLKATHNHTPQLAALS